MENITELYKRKFTRKVAEYNFSFSLPWYFAPMIGSKKDIKVADLGAGPINIIGNSWLNIFVRIYASDVLWPEYEQLWQQHKLKQVNPITYEDMEHLSYPDNFFDIVHCRNALDHTKDLHQAIKEMKRVCKPGGYIYLAHAPSQKTRFGKNHYWNIEEVELPDFTTTKEGELIVSIWKKQ